MFSWIKYSFVFGYDNAGEVVEIGSSVTRFKTGDGVIGQACGMDEKMNDSAHSSFQNYTVMKEHMTSKIPEILSLRKRLCCHWDCRVLLVGCFRRII